MELTISPTELPDKQKFQEIIQQVTSESMDDFDSRCDKVIALCLKGIVEAIQYGKPFPIAIELPMSMWAYNTQEAHYILLKKWNKLIGLPFAFDCKWLVEKKKPTDYWYDEEFNVARYDITTRARIDLVTTKTVKKMFGRTATEKVYHGIYTNEKFGNEPTDPCLARAIEELDSFLNPITPTKSEDNKT